MMGSSKVIVELEAKDGLTPELKKSLDATQALSKELLDLNGKLAILKADKKGIIKGALESDIKGVKVLQAELKELQATYAKSKGAERVTAKKNVSDKEAQIASLLTREMVKQKRVIDEKNISRKAEIALSNKIRKGYDKERAAIEKNTGSRQKENAVRRSAGTIIIRHIRQLESLIVAYYAVSSATDILIGQGVELNKKIEDSTTGIGALISANTQGASSVQKFTASMALSSQTVRDIKKASVETAATFPQLTEAFQQAIGSALSAGQSMGATTQEAIDNTIYMAKQMTNIAASIGMPMVQLNEEIRSLMEGTADQNSRIAKMIFGSAKNANQQVREAKETAGGLNELMRGVMEPFEQLSAQRTFSRLKARMTDAFDTIKIEATKPLFEDFKDQIEKTTKYVNAHSEQWIKAYHNVYYGATDTFTALSQSAKTFSNIFATAKGDIFGVTSSLFDFQETVVGATFVIQYMGGMASNAWQMVRNVGIYFESFFKDITSSFNGFILNIKLLGKEIQLALYKALDVLPVVDNTKYIAQTEKIIEKLKIKKNINSLSHEDFLLQAEERVRENREQIKSLGQITLEAKKAGYATRQIFAVGEDSRDTFLGFSIDKSMSTSTIEKTFTAYSNAYDNLVERYKGNTKALETINTTYTRNLKVMAEDYMAIEYGKLEAKIKEVVADKVLYKKLLGFRQEYFEAMGNQEEAWKIEKEKFAAERVGLEPKMYKKLLADHKIEYLGKLTKETYKTSKEIASIWDNTTKSMTDSFENNFFDALTGKFTDFKSFMKSTFSDIGNDILNPIAKQLAGSLTGASALASVNVGSLVDQGFTKDSKTGNYIGGTDNQIIVDSGGQVLQGAAQIAGNSELSGALNYASGFKSAYGLVTNGISDTIVTGFNTVANGLGSTGLIGSQGIVNMQGFGYGFANPTAYANGGATTAIQAGQSVSSGLIGGVAGYGFGALGDKLLGADTYASTTGAIGGGLALGALGLTNPIGWALLGASALLGGLFGKTKQVGSGLNLQSSAGFGDVSDIQGYSSFEKNSWFNDKSWTKTNELSSQEKSQIDAVFGTYEYLLDTLTDNKDIIVQAGMYSGTTLLDTALPKAFIQSFTGLSNIPATIGDSELDKVYDIWGEYAKSIDKTVTEALTESVNSFITAQDGWERTSAQINGDDILDYDINVAKKQATDLTSIFGSTLPQIDGLQDALDNLDFKAFTELTSGLAKGNFTDDNLKTITAIGSSYEKLAVLEARRAEQLKTYTTGINNSFNKMLNPTKLYANGKKWWDLSSENISREALRLGEDGVIAWAEGWQQRLIDDPKLEGAGEIASNVATVFSVLTQELEKTELATQSITQAEIASANTRKQAAYGFQTSLMGLNTSAQSSIDKIMGGKLTPSNNVSYLAGRYNDDLKSLTSAVSVYNADKTNVDKYNLYKEAFGSYQGTLSSYFDATRDTYKSSDKAQGIFNGMVGDLGNIKDVNSIEINLLSEISKNTAGTVASLGKDVKGAIDDLSGVLKADFTAKPVTIGGTTPSYPTPVVHSSPAPISTSVTPIVNTQQSYADLWNTYNADGMTQTEATSMLSEISVMSGSKTSDEYLLAASTLEAYGLKAFDKGGVVDRPTVALFGEGSNPHEAFVPLPDGKTIPVTMKGNDNSELIAEIKENNRLQREILEAIENQETSVNLDGKKLSKSLDRIKRLSA